MVNPTGGLLSSLTLCSNEMSRSISAENPEGLPNSGGLARSPLGEGRKGAPCLRDLAPGSRVVLAQIEGPGALTHIWCTVKDKTSKANRFTLRDLVLRIYWDGERSPSVEVPLGDFFCCGFGVACNINSLPVAVAPTRGFNSYWRMPFRRSCYIEIENQGQELLPEFFYQVDYTLSEDVLPAETLYFHAQWRRESCTERGKDYVILDGVQGRGQYVGTYLALSTLQRYWWGEGEVKFYVDGEEHPSICGTGTEDYFGGAWSFAESEGRVTLEQTFSYPFIGYPYYSRHDLAVHNDFHLDEQPPQRGLYRWHIPDPIRFRTGLKVTLQQIGSGYGGLFEREDDLSTVAYWYQNEPHRCFPRLPEREERIPR